MRKFFYKFIGKTLWLKFLAYKPLAKNKHSSCCLPQYTQKWTLKTMFLQNHMKNFISKKDNQYQKYRIRHYEHIHTKIMCKDWKKLNKTCNCIIKLGATLPIWHSANIWWNVARFTMWALLAPIFHLASLDIFFVACVAKGSQIQVHSF